MLHVLKLLSRVLGGPLAQQLVSVRLRLRLRLRLGLRLRLRLGLGLRLSPSLDRKSVV